MINSPSNMFQKSLNFSSSSEKNQINYPYLYLLESSCKKSFFDNILNNNIKSEKVFKQNLQNEFNNITMNTNNINNKIIKIKEKINPVIYTVNDEFLDLLIDIYSNKDDSEDNYDKINSVLNKLNNDNDNNDIDNSNNYQCNISDINEDKKDNNSDINNYINKINNNNNDIVDNEQISCICLRSNCNNNYCSCHKNNNYCNENCRCVNCRNIA